IGETHIAVLSHAFWQTRFGLDPAIVGQPIIVNGQSLTVVGVAPRGFSGTTLGARPDFFVPITMRERLEPIFTGFANRRSYCAYLFARLAPGVTLQQATTAVNGPFRTILDDVEAPLQKGMSPQTMARFKAKRLILDEGSRGQSEVSGTARAPLTLLLG